MIPIVLGAGSLGRGFTVPLLSTLGLQPIIVDEDEELVGTLSRGFSCLLYNGSLKRELHYTLPVYHLPDFLTNVLPDLLSKDKVMVFSSCRPNPYPRILYQMPDHENLHWVALENEPGLHQYPKLTGFPNFHLGLADVLAVELSRGQDVHAEDPWNGHARFYADKTVRNLMGDIPANSPLVFMTTTHMPARWAARFVTHNTGHAAAAYIGARLGYEKMADAAQDPIVYKWARKAMEEASSALLRSEGWWGQGHTVYHHSMRRELVSGTSKGWRQVMRECFDYYIPTEFERYAAFGMDTVERVARDPGRKLARNDRLVNPLFHYLKWYRPNKPLGLAVAIRCGLALLDYPLEEALVNICGIRTHKKSNDWKYAWPLLTELPGLDERTRRELGL